MQITAAVARESFGAIQHRAARPDAIRVRTSCWSRSSRAACARPTSTGGTAITTRRCRRCSATRAPASWSAVGKDVTQIRPRRSRRDLVSLVRRLRQLPAPNGGALPEELRSEDARHPAGRIDADAPERRAGLQRVLPAIVVCDLRHRQRALRREGPERCAARAAWAVRVQRPDRRRRGAQLHAAAAGRRVRGVRRRRGRAYPA